MVKKVKEKEHGSYADERVAQIPAQSLVGIQRYTLCMAGIIIKKSSSIWVMPCTGALLFFIICVV
jgi:hypothetical protein